MSNTYTHDGDEYEELNVLYSGYWPDEWDEEDIEAFAEIVQDELHVRIVKTYDRDEIGWSVRVPKTMRYFTEEPYYE